MKHFDNTIKDYLERFLTIIGTRENGQIGTLTKDPHGAFIITYDNTDDKGIGGAIQFLDKLKAGGFLNKDTITTKAHPNTTDIANMLKDNRNFTINIGENSTKIYFTPTVVSPTDVTSVSPADVKSQDIINGLNMAINEAEKSPPNKQACAKQIRLKLREFINTIKSPESSHIKKVRDGKDGELIINFEDTDAGTDAASKFLHKLKDMGLIKKENFEATTKASISGIELGKKETKEFYFHSRFNSVDEKSFIITFKLHDLPQDTSLDTVLNNLTKAIELNTTLNNSNKAIKNANEQADLQRSLEKLYDTSNTQISTKLHNLIVSLKDPVHPDFEVKPVKDNDDGGFVINYPAGFIGHEITTKFIEKLKESEYLSKDTPSKINLPELEGGVTKSSDKCYLKIALEKNDLRLQITFAPNLSKNEIISSLDAAIKKAGEDSKSLNDIVTFLENTTIEKGTIEPLNNTHLRDEKRPPSRLSGKEPQAVHDYTVYDYLEKKIKSVIPGADFNIIPTSQDSRNKKASFTVNINNLTKDSDDYNKITQELSRIFSVNFKVNEGEKPSFTISENPSLLLHYIRKNDKENAPKIPQISVASR